MKLFKKRESLSNEIEQLLVKLKQIKNVPENLILQKDILSQIDEFEHLLGKEIPELKKVEHEVIGTHELSKISLVSEYLVSVAGS